MLSVTSQLVPENYTETKPCIIMKESLMFFETDKQETLVQC